MEPFEQLDRVVPTLGDLVKGIRPDQLDNPTPCDKFQVRDLLGHFIGNVDRVTGALRGETIRELTPRPEMIGDDPAKTYDAVLADFRAAAEEPGAMDKVLSFPAPFGDIPMEVFARFLAFDLTVHSWDLATATGQTFVPSDDIVAEVDGFARQLVAPELRDGDTFGDEVEPPEGAMPVERLVAFAGRQP